MKTTNLFSICIAISLLGVSCKDQVRHESRILFKNSSSIACKISLFPKAAYQDGKMYRDSDVGAGFNYTTFDISPNSFAYIFYSGNPDYQPNILISQIFDSIQLRPVNQDQPTMIFSPTKAIGYPLNIFRDSSAWKYEFKTDNIFDSFSKTIVQANEYTFDFLIQTY